MEGGQAVASGSAKPSAGSCAGVYELELFDDKETQVVLENAYYTTVAPVSSITDKSPI